jgi:hypothetical protein
MGVILTSGGLLSEFLLNAITKNKEK